MVFRILYQLHRNRCDDRQHNRSDNERRRIFRYPLQHMTSFLSTLQNFFFDRQMVLIVFVFAEQHIYDKQYKQNR